MRILCFLQKKKDSKNYSHFIATLPKREWQIFNKRFHRRSSKIFLSFLSTNTWFLSLHNPPPSPWNNNKYIKACELLARRVSKFPVKRYIQCWAGKIEQFFRILFTTAPSPSHSPLSLSLSPFSVSLHFHPFALLTSALCAHTCHTRTWGKYFDYETRLVILLLLLLFLRQIENNFDRY